MSKMDVANLVVGTVAAAGGLAAAYFGWKGPTDADLKRVEKNTAETVQGLADVHSHIASMNQHMGRQEAQDVANSLGMEVTGMAEQGQLMKLAIVLSDRDIELTRVDLLGKQHMKAGETTCEYIKPFRYDAVVPLAMFIGWFNVAAGDLGNPVQHSAVLRVYTTIHNHVVYRDVPVILSRRLNQHQPGTPSLSVSGAC
jgi:hypothetical protein